MNSGYTIYIRNDCVQFDTPLVEINGRILFPMRELLQKVSGDYYNHVVFPDWSPNERVAWAYSQGTLLGFPVGKNFMWWDGQAVPLDQGAVIVDNLTRVPLRAVVEKLGGRVDWDPVSHTVNIDMSQALNIWNEPTWVCGLHGEDSYSYRALNECPSNKFLYGHWVYGTWGVDYVKERILDGSTELPAVVTFMNKMGMDKRGKPLDSDMHWARATIQTAMDVATAAWFASIFKNTAIPFVEARLESANAREILSGSLAEGKPNGPLDRIVTKWSDNAINYQVRAAGSQLVTRGSDKVLIEESFDEVALDGKKPLGNGLIKWIEAKSDDGWLSRMLGRPWFDEVAFRQGMAHEAALQFRAIRGTYSILEWRAESVALQEQIRLAWSDEALLSEFANLFPGADAHVLLGQFREMVSVIFYPMGG